jgi:hypothetical protein
VWSPRVNECVHATPATPRVESMVSIKLTHPPFGTPTRPQLRIHCLPLLMNTIHGSPSRRSRPLRKKRNQKKSLDKMLRCFLLAASLPMITAQTTTTAAPSAANQGCFSGEYDGSEMPQCFTAGNDVSSVLLPIMQRDDDAPQDDDFYDLEGHLSGVAHTIPTMPSFHTHLDPPSNPPATCLTSRGRERLMRGSSLTPSLVLANVMAAAATARRGVGRRYLRQLCRERRIRFRRRWNHLRLWQHAVSLYRQPNNPRHPR